MVDPPWASVVFLTQDRAVYARDPPTRVRNVLYIRCGLRDDERMDTAVLPEVCRVGGLIGAEIRGLDLTRDYPDETYAAVRCALDEHGVVFLRRVRRGRRIGASGRATDPGDGAARALR